MTEGRRLHVSFPLAGAAMVLLLLIGAGVAYVMVRNSGIAGSAPGEPERATVMDQGRPAGTPPPNSQGASGAPRSDVVVTLTKEAIERSGIRLTQVSLQTGTGTLRLPGVVEPNAYRQVAVTPVVGGRVVGVSVQLGDRVRKGQSIAQVYSPELADARARYVSAKAMLDAHDRELQRTQKLVDIGAASRQELERIQAEHAAQTADVESAQARLQLLGVDVNATSSSMDQASATTNVAAPIDGVVTERLVNTGLNVDPSTRLFVIVDLSNVWVVAEVYERDLQRVRVGARAAVTTTVFPDRPTEGTVSFIDPQFSAATRTAKVRVEVANPLGDLRLGMYADVAVESAGGAQMLAVPMAAVQSVGDRQVVYVASSSDSGKFIEREVRLGRIVGEQVEVLEGLSTGDSIVSEGSFYVRAEAERLGLRGTTPPAADTRQSTLPPPGSTEVQTANVAVTEKGFEPDRISLRAGRPARLTFVRSTDNTCGTEVVFPSLGIERTLPLNEPVNIEFTPSAGEISFACGMNMFKGAVVAK